MKTDRSFNSANINRSNVCKASNADDNIDKSTSSGILNTIKSFLFPWNKKSVSSKPISEASKSFVSFDNAVLVLGATGKTGFKVVKKLLENNRNVVILARNETKAVELFSKLQEAKKQLKLVSDVDVRQLGAMSSDDLKKKNIFEGVSQLVSCLGPDFSSSPGTSSTSEEIDYKATAELIQQFSTATTSSSLRDTERTLVNFSSPVRNLSQWSRLDDVLMGGSSSSKWKEVSWGDEGGSFCRWSGQLVTQGGGFCGSVVRSLPFDSQGFDGISVTLRGDGNRFKFRLKPDDVGSQRSEFQYQAVFDTIPQRWMTVHLPFESFVSVRRNDVDYSAPQVNKGIAGGRMISLGLVFSRFDFNELPNPRCSPGAFQLDVASIGLYRSVRPSFVLVSSAGTERINRLTSPEQRQRDVPIVQLNPQGILNWKYKGEEALRLSGLPYSVIRATGLVTSPAVDSNSTTSNALFAAVRRLEAHQGDTIAGRITRDELANLVAAALESPHSQGTTFEVRRDETESGKLSSPSEPNNWVLSAEKKEPEQDWDILFRGLVKDSDRVAASSWRRLPPFPIARDPAPAVTPERVQQILNDPRVQAQQSRERTASSQSVE